MSGVLLGGCRVLIDGALVEGVSVLIEAGRIAAVLADGSAPAGVSTHRLPQGAVLAPGLIDLQVNGGGGVQFNDDPTAEAARAIADAHRRFGVTGLLPTLITDAPALMERAIAAAVAVAGEPGSGVLGLHLEGPFISPARPGVHRGAFIRAPEEADLLILEAAANRLAPARLLVTLAPEVVDLSAVARLAAAGVIVSAGHSAADFETAAAGFAAGISAVTHLYNAMPGPAGRAPGLVAAALLAERVHCGLIADFVHVHPAMLRLALAAPAGANMFLVSDAMAVAGTSLDGFWLNGRWIRRVEGRLVDADGTLAGADTTLIACVRRGAFELGLGVERALAMASSVPAAVLGLAGEVGRIAPGLRADLVLLFRGAGGAGDLAWRCVRAELMGEVRPGLCPGPFTRRRAAHDGAVRPQTPLMESRGYSLWWGQGAKPLAFSISRSQVVATKLGRASIRCSHATRLRRSAVSVVHSGVSASIASCGARCRSARGRDCPAMNCWSPNNRSNSPMTVCALGIAATIAASSGTPPNRRGETTR